MDSLLLQKQVRDNAKDLQEFCKDLQDWGKEMKQKDESLKRTSNNQSEEAPSPRNKISKVIEGNKETSTAKPDTKKTKKLKGCDYAAWDKFDAEAYCSKMDKEDAEENSSPESDLSDEVDEASIDMANMEKEKGNSFVKKQQWDQAIECYTRAIESYAYDPVYYANRALCYLKKEKYRNAEGDCTTAIQLDKTYAKAYHRRATARENLNQLSEAHSDLLRVMELEPKNKESRNVLKRIEKKLESIKKEKPEAVEEPRPLSKFTLSRQKQKNSNTEETQIKHEGGSTKNEVPAIGEHVVERIAPSTSGANNMNKRVVSGDGKYTIEESESKQLKNYSSSLPTALPEDTLANRHKGGIQIFQSVFKPPRTRSKKPLKRIPITDVDLSTEKTYFSDTIRNDDGEKEDARNEKVHDEKRENKEESIILMPIVSEPAARQTDLNISDNKDNEELDLPIPKTAVQFYNAWRNISNKEMRRKYFEKIAPDDLKDIFKESLETKVFSEILGILSESSPSSSNIYSYDYLVGLSQVKRFNALIMFMSSKDKKNLSDIIDYLRKDNKYTAANIEYLVQLYEL